MFVHRHSPLSVRQSKDGGELFYRRATEALRLREREENLNLDYSDSRMERIKAPAVICDVTPPIRRICSPTSFVAPELIYHSKDRIRLISARVKSCFFFAAPGAHMGNKYGFIRRKK